MSVFVAFALCSVGVMVLTSEDVMVPGKLPVSDVEEDSMED